MFSLRRSAALVLVPLLALAAACGGEESKTGLTGQAASVTSSSSSSATTTTAVKTPQVDVTAGASSEYAYDTDLTSVPAGPVTVSLRNKGKEAHQATLLRLNDGVDLQTFVQGAQADTTGAASLGLATPYGGPNIAAPSGPAVTTTQVLTPGNYLMICFIRASDGQPHAAKGMVKPFTVTPPSETEELKSKETVTLDEFKFDVPKGFLGDGLVAVHNSGAQGHELAAFRLDAGKKLEDVTAYIEGTPSGPPPFTPVGGVAALGAGQTATVQLNLTKGSYAFICFLPDTAGDKAPHYTKGMALQVEIT